jgi:hypothetical protein
MASAATQKKIVEENDVSEAETIPSEAAKSNPAKGQRRNHNGVSPVMAYKKRRSLLVVREGTVEGFLIARIVKPVHHRLVVGEGLFVLILLRVVIFRLGLAIPIIAGCGGNLTKEASGFLQIVHQLGSGPGGFQ